MGSAPFTTRAALPTKPGKRWILVMNSEVANVFEDERSAGLRIRIALRNSDGRAKERELRSAPHGASKRESGPGHDTVSPQTSAKEHVLEVFVRDVSRMLDEALAKASWTELVVIAEAQTLGVIRREISKRVRERVVLELPKDLVTLETSALRQYIRAAQDRAREAGNEANVSAAA